MEDLFLWMLIFAGAVIGLLGTFLIASERELTKKRREIEELAAKGEGNRTVITLDQPDEPKPTEAPASAELITKNQELREEISSLSSKLEASQRTLEDLRVEQHRLIDAESENRGLRADSQRLEEEIANLKNQLQSGQSRLSESGSQAGDVADGQLQLQNEVAELRNQLELSQAKVGELEAAQQQLAESESRETILKDQQQRLAAQLASLQSGLSAEREKIHELDAARQRLGEMERLYQGAQDSNRRLEEEMSRWRERLAGSEESHRRLAILSQHLDELRSAHGSLMASHHEFQQGLAAVARLLGTLSESIADCAASSNVQPWVAHAGSGAEPLSAPSNGFGEHDSAHADSGSSNSSATPAASMQEENIPKVETAKKRRRFGMFLPVVVLAVGAAVAGGYLKPDSNRATSASKPDFADSEIAANKPDAQTAKGAGERTGAHAKPAGSAAGGAKNQEAAMAKEGKSSQRFLGAYEITRPTLVFSEPSESSQPIITVDAGSQVNVVAAHDGWLEIRSKHGRPPGYIRREAAARVARN